MFSIIFKYNTKSFLKSFFSVLVFFLFFCFVLEFLMLKKILVVKTTSFQQFQYIFFKVTALINKFFPFIIFIAGIIWVFRLKKQRTWCVFQSSGVSVLQVLKGPICAVIVISIFELLYWGPWCHKMMEKAWSIQQRDNYWIRPKTHWHLVKGEKDAYTIFYFPDKHMEVFFFKNNFVLQRYIHAKEFSVYPRYIKLKNAWDMEVQAPKYIKEYKLFRPAGLFDAVQSKHPLLMSFLELNFNTNNIFLKQTIQLRRHYFLSNNLWFCLLLPFSVSVLAGYYRSMYRYIVNIFFGSMICFLLFLAKEWSGIFAYTMTKQILSQLVVWSIPLITGMLSIVFWVEKGEL